MHLSTRCAIVCLALGLLNPTARSAETAPGLVKDKPAKGRFVKTAQGYMVEYEVKLANSDAKFTMVPIPGGTFQLGSPSKEANRNVSEGPQITVKVPPFWMQKHEVTWAEYKQYMALHDAFKSFENHKMRKITKKNQTAVITAPSNLYDTSFTYVNGEEPRLPAVTMSQYAAKQYTKWISGITGEFYRLPAEAEWEYACRAGTKTAFFFGDDPKKLDEYAWHYENSNETSHHVGLKKPNPWGLHDIHGNVSEWVLDGYRKDGHQRLAGKTPDATDTIYWTKKLFPRVCKGGNWDLERHECRSAARLPSSDDAWRGEDPNVPLSPWWFTSKPSLGVGFRIIRPLQAAPLKERPKYWEADLTRIVKDVQYRIDEEGRGARGIVDKNLPKDIVKVKKLAAAEDDDEDQQ